MGFETCLLVFNFQSIKTSNEYAYNLVNYWCGQKNRKNWSSVEQFKNMILFYNLNDYMCFVEQTTPYFKNSSYKKWTIWENIYMRYIFDKDFQEFSKGNIQSSVIDVISSSPSEKRCFRVDSRISDRIIKSKKKKIRVWTKTIN